MVVMASVYRENERTVPARSADGVRTSYTPSTGGRAKQKAYPPSEVSVDENVREAIEIPCIPERILLCSYSRISAGPAMSGQAPDRAYHAPARTYRSDCPDDEDTLLVRAILKER